MRSAASVRRPGGWSSHAPPRSDFIRQTLARVDLTLDRVFNGTSMTHQLPFHREAGSGEGVVCLHANASASAQWRALMERLSSRFRVLAPDSYGAGKSPAWPVDRVVTLSDEVALLEPVFGLAGNPFCLVGHSYGAAIALVAALARPDRVRALAVYEPTLFSLLKAEAPGQAAFIEIADVVAAASAALEGQDRSAAAERFIDYWMGAGSWRGMPESRRDVIASAIPNIRGWAHALFNDAASLADFRSLRMPILYMTGARSPASSRGVARLLGSVLPNARCVEFPGLGHMGPVTHPEVINETIARFLEHGDVPGGMFPIVDGDKR